MTSDIIDVTAVEVLHDRVVRLTFDIGEVRDIDLHPLLSGSAFQELEDGETFRQVPRGPRGRDARRRRRVRTRPLPPEHARLHAEGELNDSEGPTIWRDPRPIVPVRPPYPYGRCRRDATDGTLAVLSTVASDTELHVDDTAHSAGVLAHDVVLADAGVAATSPPAHPGGSHPPRPPR